jgi:hypothetical protein
MIVRADGGLIHAGHERGTAWRTDRRGGEEPRETHSLGREAVKVWRPDFSRAIASEVRSKVLGDQPKDVGTAGFGGEKSRYGNQGR